MKYIFALVFFITSLSIAETRKSYDALGLAMYCNEYLKAPQLEGISTLLNTFGDPLPCIEKRIAKGNLTFAQIDLIDATCWRNKTCAPGVPKPTDLKTIESRARKVYQYQQKYPRIEWWVSPALEYDEKNPATVLKMMQAAQKGCPPCKVIQSPFSGATVSGYPIEKHGTKVRAFSVSGDGASIFDADNIKSDGNGFEHNKSGSDQTHAWFNELNLRCTGEKTSTPPLKRTEKPTGALFKQAFINMQDELKIPPAPKVCKEVKAFKDKEINKPNAESYCNGQTKDVRGNKPMLILKRRGNPGERLPLYNSNGSKVGCYKYYGEYSEKGYYRYYEGDCSGFNPVELMDKLGSEYGFLDTGKGKCQLINAVRRLGVYR